MTDQIIVQQEGGIMTIRINRPEKKNALTLAMYSAMVTALQAAEADPAVRVIVFAGSPTCFTSGNDIMDFMQSPPTDASSPVFQFLQAIVEAKKPLIAAPAGLAIGIGTTMLLHCDLVYAGQETRFQLPFVNLALVPEAGSSYLLPRMMGHVRAAELLLLGGPFDTAKASEYGFVNAVLPNDQVLDAAMAAAADLAAKPPTAVRFSKELLKRYSGPIVAETIRIEAQLFAERLVSPEAGEAFAAFMERRQPDFSKFS